MSTNNLTIGTILAKTTTYLAEKSIPNPRLEADLMLAAVLKLPRVKLYSDWDRPLLPAEINNYREMIVKRVQGWPLAYLTGTKAFLSWEFTVNESVLIPRPETELLVELVYDRVKNLPDLSGVDVGTGSGVIAVSLAKLIPESNWRAIDISTAAIAVAAKNAGNLGVQERIEFIEGNLLQPLLSKSVKVDLIVANPPYIPTTELKKLQVEVQREPVLALDGGVDGLAPYRSLIAQAAVCLKQHGILAVEHGFDQREPLIQIFTGHGFECECHEDLAGLERIIIGKLTK